jgi:hypothetical protein
MTLWLIAAMTLIAFLLLNAWFSERRLIISRTGDVFMLAWFYYGFAIAIDILLGLEIQGIPGMSDFSDDSSRELLVYVLGYYLLCGGAFFLAYVWLGKTPRSLRPSQPVILPPLPVLIGAHVVLLVLLTQAGYFGLTRPQRMLLISDSLPLRLMVHSMAVLRAIDLVVIVLSTRKNYVLGAAAAAICLGLASGGRMELMSIILILVLKYRFSCSRVKFAAVIVALLAVFACWKTTYQYVYDHFFEPGTNRSVLEYANTSLSGIDSYASSLIAVIGLEEECPYYLGKTYTYDIVQAALPREWRDADFLPLSQQFDWDYLPERAEEGISMAFSAIAESWLNFGVLGPLLLGLVFGIAARVIDTRPRGVAFYIFALVVFRLFRSDFASLCKNWIVIYGGTMIACYCACVMLTYLLKGRQSATLPVRRFEQPATIGRQALPNHQGPGRKVVSHAS